MYDPERGYPIVVPCVLHDDPMAVVGWLTEVLGVREVTVGDRPRSSLEPRRSAGYMSPEEAAQKGAGPSPSSARTLVPGPPFWP
jgi:hypothetical protein